MRRTIAVLLAVLLAPGHAAAQVAGTTEHIGNVVILNTAADALDVAGGLNIGSGNVALVGADGRINGPLSLTILDDLSGANLTSLNASNISSGTLADARLEAIVNIGALVTTGDATVGGDLTVNGGAGSNVAILTQGNIFSQDQTINPGHLFVIDGNGAIRLRDIGSDIEVHVRPNGGSHGWVSWTENTVADRWVLGIRDADSNLYFASGSPSTHTDRAYLTAAGQWRTSDGSQSAPAWSFKDNTDLGIWSGGGAGGRLNVSIDNQNILYVEQTGLYIDVAGDAVHWDDGGTKWKVNLYTSDTSRLHWSDNNDVQAEFAADAAASNDDGWQTLTVDYGEFMSKLHPGEPIEVFDVVGIVEGRVTRDTSRAVLVQVVSTRAGIRGGIDGIGTDDYTNPDKLAIAYVGRVPVVVEGPVAPGDLLVPSGRHDGRARAVTPRRVTAAEFGRVFGVVLTLDPVIDVDGDLDLEPTRAMRAVIARAGDDVVVTATVGVPVPVPPHLWGQEGSR